ncbi:MAG: response regulator [Candidatus Rokuibacteriota bacterium]
MKVLVVDDDAEIRALVRDLLTDLGHEVIETASGQEAMSAIEKERPRLVLADLQMPGGGVHGIRQIAAVDPSTHLVVLSGALSRTAELILDNLGVAVLMKPFDAPDLLAIVRRAEPRP